MPSAAETNELACTYAVLILHDSGKEINQENITSVAKAAGVEVAPAFAAVFARLLDGKDVSSLLKVGGGGGGGGAAPGAAAAPAAGGAPAAAKVEEAKKSSSSSSVAGGLDGGLFGGDDGW